MPKQDLTKWGERLLMLWGLKKDSEMAGKRKHVVYKRGVDTYVVAIRSRNFPSSESDDQTFKFAEIDALREAAFGHKSAIYCYVSWHEKDSKVRAVAFDIDRAKDVPTWHCVEHGHLLRMRKLVEHIGNSYIFREFRDGADEEQSFRSADLDAAESCLNVTEGERIASYRIGQEEFSKKLRQRSDRCEVTGMADGRLLRASHILPWCESDDTQRLDPNNGILLSPNCDSAFDQHLITFAEDGSIMISASLCAGDCEKLGISANAHIHVDAGREAYLRIHRSVFAQKEDGHNL